MMKAYPDLKGVFAITSVAFPAAADAVKQAGKGGQVLVTGLATPNSMNPTSEPKKPTGGPTATARMPNSTNPMNVLIRPNWAATRPTATKRRSAVAARAV